MLAASSNFIGRVTSPLTQHIVVYLRLRPASISMAIALCGASFLAASQRSSQCTYTSFHSDVPDRAYTSWNFATLCICRVSFRSGLSQRRHRSARRFRNTIPFEACCMIFCSSSSDFYVERLDPSALIFHDRGRFRRMGYAT